MYTVLSLPYRIAFEPGFDDTFDALEWLITAIFVFDIVATFNTAAKDPVMDTLIMNRRVIADMYCRLWLWVDLVATIPIDSIALAVNPGLDTQSLKLLRLLRFFRVFKLLKLNVVYSMSHVQSTTLVFGVIAFLCHMFGCFWYYLGSLTSTAHYEDGIPQNWQQLAEQNGFIDPEYTDAENYVASFYWAATTMLTIGYGDIHAVNNKEKVFAIVTMLVGSITLGTLVDQVVKFIESLSMEVLSCPVPSITPPITHTLSRPRRTRADSPSSRCICRRADG